MARLFDDAQNEYLKIEQAVKAGVPFAFVGWFNTNDLGSGDTIMWMGDKDSAIEYFLMFVGADEKLIIEARAAAGEGVAKSTIVCTEDTWQHGCAIFATSTDRRVLLDGGSKGTNTADRTPANLDRTCIGVKGASTLGLYMSGMIAEAAIYDLSDYPGATASDKADYFEANVLPDLAAGVSPDSYQTGLLAYWPLRDDDLDYKDDFDLTPVNTPDWVAHPDVTYFCSGNLEAQSALTGNLQWLQELAGSIAGQSTVTANVNMLLVYSLSGTIAGQSTLAALLNETNKLAGLIAGQSGLTADIKTIEKLGGLIEAQSVLTGNLQGLKNLAGSVDANSALTGNAKSIESLAGIVVAQSALVGNIQFCYGSIPPEMHATLIDPYSGGAWLWLVEISILGYSLIRMARNPADVVYGGVTYPKNNFDVGLAALTGDGSVPRMLLKVAQDADYTLEDKINATKGAGGGTIRLIRAHEDFLTTPIVELEQVIRILTADSDTTHVFFQLGIPDPLLRKVPLRRYSSKTCPYALPGLFKGLECQYAGEDGTCTGKFEDCYDKGNAILWGAQLGLDPNTARI